MANREDKTRGAFFEERFQSIAILDEEALLATAVYIDLNPVAAGIAPTPETSPATSIQQRINHVEAQGRIADLILAQEGSVAGSIAAGDAGGIAVALPGRGPASIRFGARRDV